jgi:hypothetical protein
MEFRPNLASSDPFGNLLDDLFHRVDKSVKSKIDDADAAIDLKIQTAEDLGLAIENVKNAYKDSLECTIDKTSSAVQEVFNKLNDMVQKFETQEEMSQLMDEAQQLVSNLSFSSKQPKLSSLSRYLVIDDATNHVSLVTFKGNFPYSGTQGFEPSLTFSDHKCHLVKSDHQSFTFHVPQGIFKEFPRTHYSYQIGALQVPWDAGWFLSHKTQFDYKVCLGALPQTAGKGSVVYLSEQERVEDFEMNWKDSKLLEPKANEKVSKVFFTDYKKVKQEYGEASIDHQHILQISVEENGSWKIWAEPPKDLCALSEKPPEEKIALEVNDAVKEGVTSIDPEIIQEQTPVISYPIVLQNKLFELYSLLTTWTSSSSLSEQSANLLEDAEKLKGQLSQSVLSPEDAANQIEKLSQSMMSLKENTQEGS